MDVTETIEAYVDAWAERDPVRRADLLEAAFSDSGTYTDPRAMVSGRPALEQHIAGFLEQRFPTATMELRSRVDGYGKVARFGWAIVDQGATVIEGVDFVVLDDDGKIASVTGFFGPLDEVTR
jgi:hypothetical protein